MDVANMRTSISVNGQLLEPDWSQLHEMANSKPTAKCLMDCNQPNNGQLGVRGKHYEDTLFGDLITAAYFHQDVQVNSIAAEPLPATYSRDHLLTLFVELLADTATRCRLFTWLSDALHDNQPSHGQPAADQATHQFQCGLTNLLIALSTKWLDRHGTVMICNPRMLRCMDLNARDGSSGELDEQRVQNGLHNSCDAIRHRFEAMELFCLAHRAIDYFYTWHWNEYRDELESDPQRQPSAASRSMLPIDRTEPNWALRLFEATARWLLQLATPDIRYETEPTVGPFERIREQVVQLPLPTPAPAVPIYLYTAPKVFISNLPMYLHCLRAFDAIPASGDQRRMWPILQLMLVLIADQKRLLAPRTRFDALDSLELLVPRPDQPNAWYTVFRELRCRQQIVPVVLRLYEDTRQRNELVPEPENDHKPSVFAILSAMYAIAEQQQSVFEVGDGPELVRRFIFSVVDDASDWLEELTEVRRLRQLPDDPLVATAGQPDIAGWLAYLERRFETDAVDNGRYTVPELLACTVQMVAKVTACSRELCQEPAIGQKMANLANGLLRMCLQTKIDRQMIGWSERLKTLVGYVSFILLAMSRNHDFCMCLAQDARIEHIWMLRDVMTELKRRRYGNMKYGCMCPKLHKFERGVCQKMILVEAYASAPDDYLDAVSSHLMRDPVRLPTSQQIVDRSTVVRSLMVAACDPFNRQPLRMDEVQPLEELRLEIVRWKEETEKEKGTEKAMSRI